MKAFLARCEGIWQQGWFAAVLMLLAFPPFNLGLLCLVVYVPWFVSLAKAPRGRKAFWRSYCIGLALWATQMWWLVPLAGKWVGNAWLGLLPLAVVCLIGGCYYGILGLMIRRAMSRGWMWAIPILCAGMEVLRSFMPQLAFPYFLISTPLWPYPALIQTSFIGTQYLVSLWVYGVNLLVFVWLMPKALATGVPDSGWSFRGVRPVMVGVLVLLMGSLVRWMEPISGELHVVTAGQPGVDLAFTTPEEERIALSKAIPSLYSAARGLRSDLLVLPEGISQGYNDQAPLAEFTVEPTPNVLFGGHRFEDSLGGPLQFQSAFGYDGHVWKHADKARLVVFGEYVPGRGILPFLDKFKLPSGDLTAAKKTSAIQLGNLKVGPLICFEGLFFDVAQSQVENGAQLLAVMSIDDWYMGTGAPDQLRTAAVWRAVETGLPCVRAGGLGYSMVINQRGEVLAQAPLGATQAVSAAIRVPLSPQPAPFRSMVAWGLGGFCAIFGLGLILFGKSKTNVAA